MVAPRSYKEKRGRKMELIAPWTDMKERIAAEEKEHELWVEWLHLYQQYYAKTGERPKLAKHYDLKETPNGNRYVRHDHGT